MKRIKLFNSHLAIKNEKILLSNFSLPKCSSKIYELNIPIEYHKKQTNLLKPKYKRNITPEPAKIISENNHYRPYHNKYEKYVKLIRDT